MPSLQQGVQATEQIPEALPEVPGITGMDGSMSVRDMAMGFEGKKISMRQDGKGTYITISIQPNDVPVDLLSQPVGARYQIAMVLLDDHDRPVKPRDMEEGDKAVQSAAMLCRNPKFQKWMDKMGLAIMATEDACADGVRAYCSIESRSDLKTDRRGRELFHELRNRFENSFLNDI